MHGVSMYYFSPSLKHVVEQSGVDIERGLALGLHGY
jgi:hypothetical protein